MTEYQVEFVRLTARSREDEETLTDLLNERSRSGWQLVQLLSLTPRRLAAVFRRGD